MADYQQKKNLLGLMPSELKELARSLQLPAFVGKQIARWLYVHHVKQIDEMRSEEHTLNSSHSV